MRTLRARATCIVLLCALLAPRAGAQSEPRVLWRDVRAVAEPALELVFLPDGFGEEARPAFEASVREALRLLEAQPASRLLAPREQWNLHVGFVPSNAACPAQPGEEASDSAFRTRLTPSDEGGLFASDDDAIARAAQALAPGTDAVVVIVRARGPIHFATGDLPLEGARVRIPEGFESALLHELGHSLFALGDEYEGSAEALPSSERTVVALYPNLSLFADGARFTLQGATSAETAEGALAYRRGVYRSAGPCLMRELSAPGFCAACSAVLAAGRPTGPPASRPKLTLATPAPGAAHVLTFEPAAPAEAVLRRCAVLFRLDAGPAPGDGELQARFAAAHARLSRKTRYMESPWLGDGSRPGETVFSLEPQVLRCDLGLLAPGSYALVAASANLLALSPPTLLRFTVPQGPPDGEHRPR